MEQEQVVNGVSRSVAVIACAAMAFFYVAVLYAPTLILQLPPPTSYKSFLIRRFICAAVSSLLSLGASALILSIRWNGSGFGAYGIRLDHCWQALVFPLSLTSLMYSGSFVLKLLQLVDSYKEHQRYGGNGFIDYIIAVLQQFSESMYSMASNISAWRNYIVAPLTEELVFRACMIPLLLCGGFSTYTAVFLCPVFFSLAHLNHLLESCTQKNCNLVKAFMKAGLQLGYTVVFGSYASFLFVRTGHLIGPLISHVFCNYMGLPVIFSRRTGIVTLAFVAGFFGFIALLFPLTSPHLYNYGTGTCKCWHGYCNWN